MVLKYDGRPWLLLYYLEGEYVLLGWATNLLEIDFRCVAVKYETNAEPIREPAMVSLVIHVDQAYS